MENEKLKKLIKEKGTYQYLADGLTQEHQQSVKLDLLRKVDQIQTEIDFLQSEPVKQENK
jgi:hypothetical protein